MVDAAEAYEAGPLAPDAEMAAAAADNDINGDGNAGSGGGILPRGGQSPQGEGGGGGQ
jgi:hypothetical protein